MTTSKYESTAWNSGPPQQQTPNDDKPPPSSLCPSSCNCPTTPPTTCNMRGHKLKHMHALRLHCRVNNTTSAHVGQRPLETRPRQSIPCGLSPCSPRLAGIPRAQNRWNLTGGQIDTRKFSGSEEEPRKDFFSTASPHQPPSAISSVVGPSPPTFFCFSREPFLFIGGSVVSHVSWTPSALAVLRMPFDDTTF